MTPVEIRIFAVTLFLSLSALLMWKERRRLVQERLSRNLRCYVETKPAVEADESESRIAA
jgi:hypothetical protein